MDSRAAKVVLAQPQHTVRGLDAAGARAAYVRGRQAGARTGGSGVTMATERRARQPKRATLALAGGEVFEGFSCGAEGEAVGEVVFNTAHTGYQEILTDPSYAGQLVTFTVSEGGNYGIHLGDEQSARPMAAGFMCRRGRREASTRASAGA